MRTGRECVAFLDENFGIVDFIERCQRLKRPVIETPIGRDSRRDQVYGARLNGLRKAGKLTMEEGFRLIAWRRREELYPGFLTDDQRCTGRGEGPKP